MTLPVPQSTGHTTDASLWPVLQAPESWRSIDFISDLHLQASEPATCLAWQEFMRSTPADAVFILGDLFEVWVGDDAATPSDPGAPSGFEAQCAEILKAASERTSIFFIHGNRDFLLGPAYAELSGMTLLGDPTILVFAGQRWLLSHGDALCLDDSDYMKFREQVRGTQWQQNFLSQSLTERQTIAKALRTESRTRQAIASEYADLDTLATERWLQSADAQMLIHGHTHRPGTHQLPSGKQRVVLSDWDVDAPTPRAEVLRLKAGDRDDQPAATINRLSVKSAPAGD